MSILFLLSSDFDPKNLSTRLGRFAVVILIPPEEETSSLYEHFEFESGSKQITATSAPSQMTNPSSMKSFRPDTKFLLF